MGAEKATGWRVPLLFSVGIAAVAGVIYLFLPGAPQPEELPTELVRRAEATRLDMDTERNRTWKDAILDAASGFAPQHAKDDKLLKLLRSALGEGNMDAAYAAAVQVRGHDAGELAKEEIFQAAMAQCATLAYGVYPARDHGGRAEALRKRWEECEGK